MCRLLTVPVLLLGLVAACGPTDPATMDPLDLVQSGCETDGDCAGGRCIAGIGEGLCTANCTTQDDCPDGTVCADTEASQGVCLLQCDTVESCADHLGGAYACDTETDLTTGEDVQVCIDSA